MLDTTQSIKILQIILILINWDIRATVSNNVEVTHAKLSSRNTGKVEIILSEFEKTAIYMMANVKEALDDLMVSSDRFFNNYSVHTINICIRYLSLTSLCSTK